MGDFTEAQLIAFAMIPKISAVLSSFGSIWILVEVYMMKAGQSNAYHRILAAMAVYDLAESIWNFISTWAMPEGTEDVWQAKGNQGTCIAQGFFLQLGLAMPLYNAVLSVYYVMTVRYKIRPDRMGRYEYLFHGIPAGIVWTVTLAGIPLDLYNPEGKWFCWIAPYPDDCNQSYNSPPEERNCERGDNAGIYRFAFYLVWVWLSVVTALVMTVVLY